MIKIEKNIPLPSKNSRSVCEQQKKELEKLEVGDSFIVKNVSLVQQFMRAGKDKGMVMTSRKNYIGPRKDQFNFRVWYERPMTDVELAVHKQKQLEYRNRYKKPTVSKTKVNGKETETKVHDTCYGCNENILLIAELKAENKKIVEDMEKINKIMIEENIGWNKAKFN